MSIYDSRALQHKYVSYDGVIFVIATCILLFAIWIGRKMASFPQAPNNLDIPADFSLSFSWFLRKKWLFKGRAMLIKSYLPGKTFMLPTLKNYCVFISAEKNIKEFASSSNFSLYEAYDDLFAYRYNKLWHDQSEKVNINRVYYFRVLREGLTSRLPTLYPYMHGTLVKGFADHLRHKKAIDGWKKIHHYQFLHYITSSVLGPIVWGEKLWADAEFQAAARRIPTEYAVLGEILQHIPTFAVSPIKAIVTRGNQSRNVLIKRLLPIIREQLAEARDSPKSEENLPFVNFIQYIVLMTQGKPYWTPERIMLLLDSLWRASTHTVPITLTHVVNSLCQYPEYIDFLREEIDQQPEMNSGVLESLPLLNSFIKEVIRTKPSDSVSTRRKALKSYTFEDGPYIPAGNLVCIPSYNIMNDATLYSNPQVFDGLRFAAPVVVEKPEKREGKQREIRQSKVTDVDLTFPAWGYGKEACPGRFFASLEMKSVIAVFVSRYDFKLANAGMPTTWAWRTFLLPRKDAVLLVRERAIR